MGDWVKLVREVIPHLSNALHKGQMGRIGVVGGSKERALFCCNYSALLSSAAQAIKCYSPELIVHPTLDNDLTESLKWASKMHSVVIGPGLGVSENILNTIEMPTAYASLQRTRNWFLGAGPSDDPQETSKLAAALGNLTIIRKGPKDIITDGENILFCDTDGSPRRCGGQGDLLSGAAAVFSHWFSEKPPMCSPSAPMIAGLAACILTRRCAERAFSKYGRGTLTTRMIDEIATAFDELFGD
ncbi:ATP-dependent S NAD P H-hydrate dehydratase [Taenia crassiceps]|uniref:ATP-dependent (S)-NAD(P)H-hydrate dehydratase n=1 Tax=Taenia crassiceps TaxID=6207 RepID=A0ABR4QFD2_9CEST